MNEKPQETLADRQWLTETMDSLPGLRPAVRQKLEGTDAETLALIRQCRNAFDFQRKVMTNYALSSLEDYKRRYDFVDEFLNLMARQRVDAKRSLEKSRTQMSGLMNPKTNH